MTTQRTRQLRQEIQRSANRLTSKLLTGEHLDRNLADRYQEISAYLNAASEAIQSAELRMLPGEDL